TSAKASAPASEATTARSGLSCGIAGVSSLCTADSTASAALSAADSAAPAAAIRTLSAAKAARSTEATTTESSTWTRSTASATAAAATTAAPGTPGDYTSGIVVGQTCVGHLLLGRRVDINTCGSICADVTFSRKSREESHQRQLAVIIDVAEIFRWSGLCSR